VNYKIAVNNIDATEKEQNILRTLTTWLPSQILDIHTHFGLPEHVLFVDEEIENTSAADFLYCDYETHQVFNNLLKGIRITQVAFSFPFKGINIVEANNYILRLAQCHDNIIPFLTGMPENKEGVEYTISEILSGKYKGLKCYGQRLKDSPKNIQDFFRLEMLQAVNSMGLPIILHIPGELNNFVQEILELANNYPKTKFILAHMGRQYLFQKDYPETLEKLRQSNLNNIFLDTSFCMDSKVIKCGLEIMGYEKILYGSDQPYNMIKGRIYKHPLKGARIMANQKYPWVNSEEWCYYKHQIKDLVYVELEILLAIKAALANIKNQETIKQRLFLKNAIKVLNITL